MAEQQEITQKSYTGDSIPHTHSCYCFLFSEEVGCGRRLFLLKISHRNTYYRHAIRHISAIIIYCPKESACFLKHLDHDGPRYSSFPLATLQTDYPKTVSTILHCHCENCEIKVDNNNVRLPGASGT